MGFFNYAVCCKILTRKKELKTFREKKQKRRFLKSVTLPMNEKGAPFVIFQHPFCCKYQRIEKGAVSCNQTIFERSLKTPKKNREASRPLASSGFVGYGKKSK